MAQWSVWSRLRAYLELQVTRYGPSARRSEREALQRFSRAVVQQSHQNELSEQLTATLCASLDVGGVALYLDTPGTGLALTSTAGTIDAPALVKSDLVIAAHNGLSCTLISPPPAGRLGSGWEGCVPLRVNGSNLGLIALAPKRRRRSFDEADRTLLAMVATQVAMALKNVQYAEEIQCQHAAIEELRKRLEAETVALHTQPECPARFAEIVGSSAALLQVLRLIERVAPTTASILITGETGTGKELIARAVHQLSPRCAGPLVSVNCPAIPPTLAESELFGHERGAFTDAIEARPGKFELADTGTIFLDEVAELSPDLQVKLLRVLQERETQRVGGRKTHKLDLRVVAATNRDLHAEMRGQRFREDLYFRLAAVVVHVPPLRARVEDIPMLASCFLDRAAATYQKTVKGFTPEAMAALRRYGWPGNVRELQHVVERAVLLCPAEVIAPEHLSGLAVTDAPRPSFGLMMREEKLRRIRQALAQTGGNQAAAARLLGVSRSNLGRLIKALGVKPPSDA